MSKFLGGLLIGACAVIVGTRWDRFVQDTLALRQAIAEMREQFARTRSSSAK